MKGRVLDAVAVDLADVEVGLDFGDFGGDDVVGGAPDAVLLVSSLLQALVVGGTGEEGGWLYWITEGFPEGPLDQCDDSAWGAGCAAVVLASGSRY